MSRIKQTEVFKYDELDERAQERARDWYRQCDAGDNYFSDGIIETAADAADMLGIDLRQRKVQLMGGGHRYKPEIYWSGFSSQGDGACFVGTWGASKLALESTDKLKAEWPTDAELARIADGLADIAAKYPNASASIEHTRGNNMRIDCESGIEGGYNDDENAQADADFPDDDVKELLRDFAHWIYRALEKEYEYVNADDQVAENIRANEYEFDSEGSVL